MLRRMYRNSNSNSINSIREPHTAPKCHVQQHHLQLQHRRRIRHPSSNKRQPIAQPVPQRQRWQTRRIIRRNNNNNNNIRGAIAARVEPRGIWCESIWSRPIDAQWPIYTHRKQHQQSVAINPPSRGQSHSQKSGMCGNCWTISTRCCVTRRMKLPVVCAPPPATRRTLPPPTTLSLIPKLLQPVRCVRSFSQPLIAATKKNIIFGFL